MGVLIKLYNVKCLTETYRYPILFNISQKYIWITKVGCIHSHLSLYSPPPSFRFKLTNRPNIWLRKSLTRKILQMRSWTNLLWCYIHFIVFPFNTFQWLDLMKMLDLLMKIKYFSLFKRFDTTEWEVAETSLDQCINVTEQGNFR